jgi:hypothetical protein
VLTAPEIDGVTPRRVETTSAPDALVSGIALQLSDDGTAVVLDLEPILGVRVAALLNSHGCARAVLVLPRWSYAEALLPVDGLLDSLITESKRLTKHEARGNVVFVLDADRNQAIVRPMRDRRADNRYVLSPADLPNLASLRAAGIQRLVKIVQA